jgi:hypothetical protein
MKSFFIQKNSILLLLGIIVIVSASLVYLFTAGKAALQQSDVTPTATAPYTPQAELSQARPAKPCSLKQRDFQMGIAFPQWGPTAYGQNDAKWVTELPDMRAQTAACWVEMPVLLYQSSLTSTTVTMGPSTPFFSIFSEQ